LAVEGDFFEVDPESIEEPSGGEAVAAPAPGIEPNAD
jgi:hypothetical protein